MWQTIRAETPRPGVLPASWGGILAAVCNRGDPRRSARHLRDFREMWTMAASLEGISRFRRMSIAVRAIVVRA
jgi:hypothetical protein